MGPGVSDNDMPNFPWQTRPETRALDALLSGNCTPEDAPARLRPVAELFAALHAPADQREAAGWGEALIAYREMASMRGTSSRPRPRRPRLIPSPLSAKLTAAGVAVVTVLGGGMAAAYTGSLPVALQKIAHDTIAAPVARESRAAPAPHGPGHPAGPPAAGSAAYGLCTAYQHAGEHGDASRRAVAFRNLVHAAGGVGQVAAYCAGVRHPGAANPPGRAGPTGPPAHPGHRPEPTAVPTKGKGGNGNGNAPGKQS
jgi:hypothetical protein